MPNTFVPVGAHWINLDLVTGIELIPDPQDRAKLIAARVWYSSGQSQDFSATADVQALAGWLRSHQAP